MKLSEIKGFKDLDLMLLDQWGSHNLVVDEKALAILSVEFMRSTSMLYDGSRAFAKFLAKEQSKWLRLEK